MRTLAVRYRFCSRLLVLLAVLSVTALNAAAVPIGDYRVNLEIAIADLESIIDRGGHESDTDYEVRFFIKIGAIRSRLPRTQQVEWEQTTWSADNNWLHTAFDEIERMPADAERLGKLESLLERLRAVAKRVTDLETSTRVQDDKGAAKQKMESILARPEYASASRGPNALAKLIRDIVRWFEELMPKAPGIEPGRARFVSGIVQIVVVGTALLLILYVAWLLLRRFRRPRKAKVRKKREARIVLGERLKPEDTATDLLAEAEALARSGDLRAAIRKGYIALLVELGDRNVISLAQYKTNRDYLRSVSNLPQLHSPLQRVTESFERHWYGFAQATPNDWQDFRAGYREALQTGN